MKTTPAMVDAAMKIANLHGLVAATGMSSEQYRAVLTNALQAALDADPFLAKCERVLIGADMSQLRVTHPDDAEDVEQIVRNCHIKILPPGTEVAGA